MGPIRIVMVSPYGSGAEPGQVYECDERWARILVRAGYAEPVDEPIEAVVDPMRREYTRQMIERDYGRCES